MKNNILRIVKMAAFYSLTGIVLQAILVTFLFASPSEGQNLRDVKVSVRALNITLEQALQLIEQKTNFKFTFFEDNLPLQQKATVIVEEESLYNILEVFAKDYGLTFNRINDQIVVKKNQGQKEILVTSEENGTIKGTVKEARTNQPIPGANVVIMNLKIGNTADVNGNYTINNVPEGKYIVQISGIGYGKIRKSVTVAAGKT
ncbi:MAG: hypothetical protein C0412_20100, partial [Flavobacterium sp.]|nr:hypothetical protein [Flavobacterium sp.]